VPRKAAGGGQLFVARQAFAAQVGAETIIIQPGQVVDANDPILKGRESLFDDFAPKIRKYPGQRVEQATAAPGEKRGA
jgi:hypothetical protein